MSNFFFLKRSWTLNHLVSFTLNGFSSATVKFCYNLPLLQNAFWHDLFACMSTEAFNEILHVMEMIHIWWLRKVKAQRIAKLKLVGPSLEWRCTSLSKCALPVQVAIQFCHSFSCPTIKTYMSWVSSLESECLENIFLMSMQGWCFNFPGG